MKNGSNIGPIFGQRILVGPDIEVPGWGQVHSSPYQLPVTLPTEWNGPDRPDFTRGRHPFRTVPRGQGYVRPTDNPLDPSYAHGMGMVIRGYSGCTSCGMGQAEVSQKMPTIAVILLGAGIYGIYKALKEGMR